MIDGNTLLFVLACGLFIAAWCAFFFSVGSSFTEAMSAHKDSTDTIALIVAGVMMLASGGLHWTAGTWGWFAWPWATVSLLLALLIVGSKFVPWFRIGAPAVLAAISAALLLPLFL